MKNIIIFLSTLLFSSCVNIDDGEPTITFKNEEITKDFLINEEWLLSTVSANFEIDFNNDGSKSRDIITQLSDCQLDDTYIFEDNNENTSTYNENSLICNMNESQIALNYEFNSDEKILNLSKLIGFNENYNLNDIEFLTEVNDGYKVIIGSFTTSIDETEVFIRYSLINENLESN